VITSTSVGCPFNETNNRYSVRFRPSGLGDGDTSTISLFTTDSARNFQVDGPLLSSVLKTATVTEIFDYASNPSNVEKIRFIAQTPATITTTTINITARGVITGWDDVPACTLNFRMTVTKRVES
jgi:hypothetical protein